VRKIDTAQAQQQTSIIFGPKLALPENSLSAFTLTTVGSK
jgi:hypothetical protein